LPDYVVRLSGKVTRSLTDFCRADELDGPERCPELVEQRLGPLVHCPTACTVLMQRDGKTFCFLRCLDKSNEVRQPHSAPFLHD
jgi:hypothetical protein